MKHLLSLACLVVLSAAACGPASLRPVLPTATSPPAPSLTAARAAPTPTRAQLVATLEPPSPSSTASPWVPSATPASPTVQLTPTSTPGRTAPPPEPSATSQPTVRPVPVPPVIYTFAASPAEVAPGQSVTLSWRAAGEWARLTPLDWQGKLTNVSIPLPLSGTLVVTPTVASNAQGYLLFAGTGNAYVSASVEVKLACPATWFFPKPPPVCPLSAPHTAAMAAQPFEHGLMLWVDHWTNNAPAVIVLFNPTASGGGNWGEWVDEWAAGLPEDDPTLTPPPGLYQPRRGFGKVWREQPTVRDRLGWATAPETALPQGTWQGDSLPKYNSVYISGPNGQVYVLGAEHARWAIWAGPP